MVVDIWLALIDMYENPTDWALFLASTIGLEVKLCENQNPTQCYTGVYESVYIHTGLQ